MTGEGLTQSNESAVKPPHAQDNIPILSISVITNGELNRSNGSAANHLKLGIIESYGPCS
ncbi:uncharacterized protein G2W53_000765 [Senna tora]|uniref:Uncharacterized protein n=1 Tax=Senna tora TaxID=362788 RepID=A0A834XG81_9FABA|nr:uncharacterized protein G2W53_000765 [Senna tora]